MSTAALSVSTHFSIKSSLIDPGEIGRLASEHGYDSVAIVDNMNINALVELTKSCKKYNIKPIIGVRLAVYDNPLFKQTKAEQKASSCPNEFWMPKVYAINEEGMKGIIRLLADANDDDHFYYTPRTGLADVIGLVESGNVVLLSGDVYGLFSHKRGQDIANEIKAHSDANKFYIELVPQDSPLYDCMNKKAYRYATLNDINMIATTPFYYEKDEDVDSLDIMHAVVGNESIDSIWLSKSYVRTNSFKPISDLAESLDGLDQRISLHPTHKQLMMDNISVVSELCVYEWREMPISLPVMGDNEMQMLVDLVKAGWKKRLGEPIMGFKPDTADLPVYKDRLKYELEVLRKMGFERYFLLVSDIVNWSKENAIMVGCGRGSAAGSLVSYLLGITDVDPIRFGLIFERFINPERIDLPDIDLDFASSRREEVITYIKTKYGEENVAGISNYVMLGSASGVRSVGKYFGLSPLDMTCTKLMPKDHGEMIRLDIAAEMVPEIDKFKDAHPEVWLHAQKLVGVMKNYGKHAAGIVVAGEPIRNRSVLERRSGSLICNWDKDSVEKFGLIKIDVLGLSTLDVIDIAIHSIKRRLGVIIEPLKIPLDDVKTLNQFADGNGVGIFQFDGKGVQTLLKSLARDNPLTFEEVSAATALYRPGPIDAGLMEDYIRFRQGADPSYDHPNTVAALEPTGGVLIYQEQTMQLARDVAGFSMSEADTLRKIIGKKQKDAMADMRDKFVDGCVSHSQMSEREGGRLFDTIEKFAGYGFNKSHSVAYAMISYTSMWLKTHYPLDFFAAAMSILGEDKLPALVADANHHGIEIYPPDINISTDKFEVFNNKALVAPFNSIKGVSTNTAIAIIDARAKVPGGLFTSVDHLLSVVEKRKCNIRVIAALDKVGAFAHIVKDSLPPRHPDRLKDQMELMPGLPSTTVSVNRKMVRSSDVLATLGSWYAGMSASCESCSLSGGMHPTPIFGQSAKFMVIIDCPTNSDDKVGKLMSGDPALFVKQALVSAGLSQRDGYFTTLVKSIKNGKTLSNEQINGCSRHLEAEINLLKPAVIVLMGGESIRKFLPGEKKPSDIRGRVIYSKTFDANIVVGMNPAIVFFNPDKQSEVDGVFKVVAELINN